ncbi:hypothetical protein BSKO_08038 [Bryopsis sp. KO-2023]|nr:hypothetical protein BSKO_08038 [Bryopsis sp. KO-2023]
MAASASVVVVVVYHPIREKEACSSGIEPESTVWMENCLRNGGSILLESPFNSANLCKTIVHGKTPKRPPVERDDPSEAWQHRLALEQESRAICKRIQSSAIRDRVVALPRDGGGATVVCCEAANRDVHEFLARMQSQMGIAVDGMEESRASSLTMEEGIEALRRSVVVALHRGGWRELGDDILLNSDFLSAPPGETSECMAVSIDIRSVPDGGKTVALIARSGVVRFRPWSLEDALNDIKRELAGEVHANPDFWRDPVLVSRVRCFLRGVKCTVLPDCRPASICSVRKEHPSVAKFWLDNCGYQLPQEIPHYIDVTFDMEQCDDEAAMTIPSCCAWSLSGLSHVNSKSRCGGHERIMKQLEADLSNVRLELWGGSNLKLIECNERLDMPRQIQEHEGPTSLHLDRNVSSPGWCTASKVENDDKPSDLLPKLRFEGKICPFPMLGNERRRHAGFERGSVEVGRLSWRCQRRLASWVKTSGLVKPDECQECPKHQLKRVERAETAGFVKPVLLGRRKGGVPCGGVVAKTVAKHQAPHISKRTLQRPQQEVPKMGKTNKSKAPKAKAFGVTSESSAPSRKPAAKPPDQHLKGSEMQQGTGSGKEKGEIDLKSGKPTKEGAACRVEKLGKAKKPAPDEKKGRPLDEEKPLAPPKKRAKAGDLDPKSIEGKVRELLDAGKKLVSLSVPEMKCFLKSKKLPVGGKKAILQERIMEFLAKEVEP